MATYKVIQDIEADDKLFGPFSLKQFIYFAICIVCLYITFLAATKGAGFVGFLLVPPAAFFGVLAYPWSKAQPTEIWLLAKVRFFFKPRKRIWDQSGVKQLVSITAPKKIEQRLTDGLDQTQVRSRLSALAQTVDSRGWAVKQLSSAPFGPGEPQSDRLTSGTTIQQTNISSDVSVEDDVLDETNNPTAQKIDQMISSSTKQHRENIREKLSHPEKFSNADDSTNPDYWFMSQNDPSHTPIGMQMGQGNVVTPHNPQQIQPSDDPQTSQSTPQTDLNEDEILEKIHSSKHNKELVHHNSRVKTILPIAEQKKKDKQEAEERKKAEAEAAKIAAQKAAEAARKSTPDPAILGLANNDDLNVETIARQANKRKEEPPDEVVISLH